MNKLLHRLSALCLLLMAAITAHADDGTLYTWDFTDANSACTLVGGGQGTTFSYPSDADANVKLEVDATNGKFNPRGNDVQVNATTTINVPVKAKGDVITIYNYRNGANGVTYTIGAETKTATDVTYEYTVSKTEATTGFVTITVTGSGYMDKFTVLQHQPEAEGGKTYTNEVAKVVWAMNDADDLNANVATPEGVFSTIAFAPASTVNIGNSNGVKLLEITDGDGKGTGVQGIVFAPAGKTDLLTWNVKPAAGLTFTPTRLSGYVNRDGTDVENGLTISAYTAGANPTQLGTWTALRRTKTTAQKSYDATAIYKYEIELTAAQQAAFASADGFFLTATVGVGSGKTAEFGEVTIEGLINGTAADVAKYTLTATAAPAEGGEVSVYPVSEQYEEGTELTLTATEHFGYDFVNWTNAAGEEVSAEAKFKFELYSDETLTANFKKVETYALNLTVDGTNGYMVAIDPAPTMVDGKKMYEAGTAVQLTANEYEGLVTFNNWSDGETAASKLITMTGDINLTAVYSEADIIAGWDFYLTGGNGRKADFAAQDNEADALSLVNTETGETQGWLDKSTMADGGYESFKGAAVNWRTGASNGDVGNWHWQTKVNAEAFTDINVQFQMLYNYNAYQTYLAEYSLDGEQWSKFGSITMEGAKSAAAFSKTLPEACNNQKDLYIRMIADKTSQVDGTSSKNDGNTLAMFFITGTPKLVNDGVAPILVSSVPAKGATGASATGKIVLTFDERIKVKEGTKATLGAQELTPTVSGKTVTFEYKGLEYSTEYTFALPANSVADLTDNYLAEAITITFTTMVRPSVTKGLYDQVVSNVDELVAALKAAESRSDQTVRYRIFIKNGKYVLPRGASKHYRHTNGKSGSEEVVYHEGDYTDPITYFNASNVSFIGESRDGVIITNDEPDNLSFDGTYGKASVFEGIGNSDVFQIGSKVSGLYWQDLTVSTGMSDGRGRDIAIQDKGTKNVYKNTCLHGYQDTWTSNNGNGLYYFEGGVIRGRTDYMCGKGDIFFNEVELRQLKGGYAAVPSVPAKIGWVYKDCIINGDENGVDGNYTLGRPWGSGTPTALFINTKMNVLPSAIGWNEMSNGWPKRFAEYNSMSKSGSPVDLSGRKKTFGDGHANDPELTPDEAALYSNMAIMFGDWDPTLLTEQAPVPANVKLEGTTLTWDNSDYALLYAVVKNGQVVDFTTEATFTVDDATATYAVRAANEMGGLGEAAVATVTTGIEEMAPAAADAQNEVHNLQGIRINKVRKGLNIIGGRVVIVK